MNIKRVATSLAALTILAGVPAIAFAETAAPITITASRVTPVDLDNGSGSGAVSVNFTNNTNQTATEVVFALDHGGAQFDTYYAEGSFAPGVAIAQTFDTVTDVNTGHVKVEEVHFADGSVWAADAKN
jgi:hypothetical protein